jgi:Holliday junction resolvase RusA-like endonuclease
MNQLSFFAPGIPKGQPRVRACIRGRHAGVYDPGTANDWKACVMLAANKALAGATARPVFIGPLRVGLEVVFPRPKSHFTAKGALKPSAPLWHTGKPDRDNLDKGVLDALTQIQMWADDAQVCDGPISKRFAALGEASGCHIHISILE